MGNLDSSIYVDTDCDPRFSSCDTNSNEEFSNTDSDTVETIDSSLLSYYRAHNGGIQVKDWIPYRNLDTINRPLDSDGEPIVNKGK
jgi:hypothetical protein